MFLSACVTSGKILGEMAIGFSRYYFDISEELVVIQESLDPDNCLATLWRSMLRGSGSVPSSTSARSTSISTTRSA